MDYLITLWDGERAKISRGGGLPSLPEQAMEKVLADIGVFFRIENHKEYTIALTKIDMSCSIQGSWFT